MMQIVWIAEAVANVHLGHQLFNIATPGLDFDRIYQCFRKYMQHSAYLGIAICAWFCKGKTATERRVRRIFVGYALVLVYAMQHE